MGHNSVVRTPVPSRPKKRSLRVFYLLPWVVFAAGVLGSWRKPTFECSALTLLPKQLFHSRVESALSHCCFVSLLQVRGRWATLRRGRRLGTHFSLVGSPGNTFSILSMVELICSLIYGLYFPPVPDGYFSAKIPPFAFLPKVSALMLDGC